MVAVAILLAIYIAIYSGFIFALVSGFSKVKTFEPRDSGAKTTFSVIVPFRTEEKNLPKLLASFKKLEYPKERFELIFINDASEDFSENIINRWRIENGAFTTTMIDNIRISGAPKKDAISRAMPIVKGEFAITTDADCEVPPSWLATFDDFIAQTNARMVAGPVAYGGKNSLLHHFQRLDLLSLQSVTIASFGNRKPFMCNGANFAYAKDFFNAIGGFAGVDSVASGDDVLLLQKAVNSFPDKVAYLKSRACIVTTQPAKSWTELLNQRVRWASKTSAYEIEYAQNLALVTFLANLALVASVALAGFRVFNWQLPLALFVFKLLPDWIAIAKANRFFNGPKFVFPVFASLIYPFFVVIVAVWALSGSYVWKGRKFR